MKNFFRINRYILKKSFLKNNNINLFIKLKRKKILYNKFNFGFLDFWIFGFLDFRISIFNKKNIII
jgi:hypothetical protein